ncbi:WAT1-related protein At4g30420-like [Carex rostrata]
MGSFAEGVFTVETKEVSRLAPQGRINEELLKIKSFERMYNTKYGPFTIGDIEWEIRLYPVGEFVWCHWIGLGWVDMRQLVNGPVAFVPICKSYSDPLSLLAWICLMSALQAAAATFYMYPGDLSIWCFTSLSDLFACIYAGFFGSAVTFYLQSWCISVRGPLYSAMFSPLSTIITTVLSSIILHEELHIGSFVGATAIIGGLYVVLWGKAEDLRRMKEQRIIDYKKRIIDYKKISTSIETESQNCETDIEQPLLTNKSELEK